MSLVILSSCNKEEESSYNYTHNPGPYIYDYYFKGVVKDTSNNVSLVNHRLNYLTCDYSIQDTIKDSTYFYHFRNIGGKHPCFYPAVVYLKNIDDSLILEYTIADSLKKLDDTVMVNI
ncbi:MAG: hypothetical protein ACPGVD_12520, partial [Flavobacteriales bacterium]